MIDKIRKAQESEKGFTLVELLVVIIIIGILAAVAIPAFLNQRQRANDAAVQADVKNLATQIETALVQTPNATIITSGGTDAPGISHGNGAAHVYVGNTAPTGAITASTTGAVSANLTQGVQVKAFGSNRGYVILGVHSNGKQFNPGNGPGGAALKFDSATGGIKSGTVTWTEGI